MPAIKEKKDLMGPIGLSSYFSSMSIYLIGIDFNLGVYPSNWLRMISETSMDFFNLSPCCVIYVFS